MVVPFDGDVAPILFADTRPILVVFTQEGKGTSEPELALKEAAPDLLGKVKIKSTGLLQFKSVIVKYYIFGEIQRCGRQRRSDLF